MRFTPTKLYRLLAVIILLGAGMTGISLTKALAQETPTVRPFPARPTSQVTAATVEPMAADQQPTARPFPARATSQPTTTSVEATAVTTLESTAGVTAESTAALTAGDALATASAAQAQADQLRADNKALQDQLASAQTDKGATLYAIVIVVIGALLAFGVFFGLRRSGK